MAKSQKGKRRPHAHSEALQQKDVRSVGQKDQPLEQAVVDQWAENFKRHSEQLLADHRELLETIFSRR